MGADGRLRVAQTERAGLRFDGKCAHRAGRFAAEIAHFAYGV